MKSKPLDKILNIVLWLALLMVGLATGGQFIDGAFLGTKFLTVFSPSIHTFVGWFIALSTIAGSVFKLFEIFK